MKIGVIMDNNVKAKQEILLSILVEFADICEKNNLTYFLGGGTLLGAVRHKGFIPWDDDIDVFMPRKDYEKLYQIWDEVYTHNKRYTLIRTNKEQNYHFRCMGIADKDTTLIKKYNVNEDIVHGIFIDIMPMDGIPVGKFAQAKQLVYAVLFNICNVQRVPNFENRAIAFGAKIFLALIPSKKMRYKIWKYAEKEMSKYSLYEEEYCKELTTNTKALGRKLPSSWFRETVYAEFENKNFRIPKYAREYLAAIFGNYMELPPEAERVPRHDETVLFEDLKKTYKEYKGIYYCKGKK